MVATLTPCAKKGQGPAVTEASTPQPPRPHPSMTELSSPSLTQSLPRRSPEMLPSLAPALWTAVRPLRAGVALSGHTLYTNKSVGLAQHVPTLAERRLPYKLDFTAISSFPFLIYLFYFLLPR